MNVGSQTGRSDMNRADAPRPRTHFGGVPGPPDDHLRHMREVCRRHGLVSVAGEVLTGFGRLGRWFAFHDACAAILKNIEIIEREGICARTRDIGTLAQNRLGALRDGHRVA